MATIKINGPRKNKVCQRMIGKRQANANLSIRLLLDLFAEFGTDVGREAILSLSN